MRLASLLCVALMLTAAGRPTVAQPVSKVTVRGRTAVGRAITLDVHGGPLADELGGTNPFLDDRMTVTFTHDESGASIAVPGYFAADGEAGNTGATRGDVWRAHFVPDRPGRWSFEVAIRTGDRVALSDDPDAGAATSGQGSIGAFTVGPDPEARGVLRHDGGRYLRYAGTGEVFLKGGADSPENLLAYSGFDGTTAALRTGRRPGEADAAGLHRYAPHVRDWSEGDPTWKDGKGKGIIGAINYLASKGVNSVYFLTMNIRGDGRDVWPYTDPDERSRFDVSKLDQWEAVFDHMDRKGMVLHVLLTETENENLYEYEEGDTQFADARKLYYRELIARFAHHPALVWNLGEENGGNDGPKDAPNPYGLANTDAQRKAFADFIRALDPYDHPIVVHTFPGQYEKIYRPLLGHPTIDGPSLQMGDMTRSHAETIRWLVASAEAGHPWFVCVDEIGPADTGVQPDADDPGHDGPRRQVLWGNLMAGGSGVEWYFGYKYPDNDLNLEDFRSRDRIWDQTRIALEFFRGLPLAEMWHDDAIVARPEGGYGLAAAGRRYVVYLNDAGDAAVELPAGRYSVRWFDPRNGGPLRPGTVAEVEGGGVRSIGRPPADPGEDWAAVLEVLPERNG